MKAKGQDLIDFWKTWPPGPDVYCEEAPITQRTDGVVCEAGDLGDPEDPIDPERTYTIDYGSLGWQGKGDAPMGFDDDFCRVFRKWVKARTVVTLVVEVPRESEAKVREALTALGVKVKA